MKEDLSEKEYIRLKMLEKDWLGIRVQRLPRRHYPFGRVAGDLIGYMGAINRSEYEKILNEIQRLNAYLAEAEAGENPLLPNGMESMDQVKRAAAY